MQGYPEKHSGNPKFSLELPQMLQGPGLRVSLDPLRVVPFNEICPHIHNSPQWSTSDGVHVLQMKTHWCLTMLDL